MPSRTPSHQAEVPSTDPRPGSPGAPDAARQRLEHSARQAVYTAVGAGILTFQRAQVVRRQWERALVGTDPASGGAVAVIAGVAAQARAAAGAVAVDGAAYLRMAEQAAENVDRAVDAVLDRVEELLPEGPRAALAQGRANTRELRRLAATLLGLTIPSDRPPPVEAAG